jgi:hypothetical protein
MPKGKRVQRYPGVKFTFTEAALKRERHFVEATEERQALITEL